MSSRTARVIMLQGTSSSVGKSLLVAALCRILRQDGYAVAPFKAQNMALNAGVTADGLELGRAQIVQAEAAGIEPTVDMNPILLKPEGNMRSQVIVRGKPAGHLSGMDYLTEREQLWGIVTESLDRLRASYDVVVIEGAGSPAEINLKAGDIVNMRVAEYADAPVLLVGDIDRGGVFAALIGTLVLLDPPERARIKGLLINKFRGHRALLDPGLAMLEERAGVPVLGVVPYLEDLGIADEDSVSIERQSLPAARRRASAPDGQEAAPDPLSGQPGARQPELDVAVIRLPHISNFDDFDLLDAEPAVALRYVFGPDELGTPDLVILPGTKATIADLQWLRERGLADRIVQLAAAGTPVLGVCGGYQMLGKLVDDPIGIEGVSGSSPGLGLLPVVTVLEPEKRTRRVQFDVAASSGLFAGARGTPGRGYEIHVGRTYRDLTAERSSPARGETEPVFVVTSPGEPAHQDGCQTTDGRICGTYIHALFENAAMRRSLVEWLAARSGLGAVPAAELSREAEYERLAATVRSSVDLDRIYREIGLLA